MKLRTVIVLSVFFICVISAIYFLWEAREHTEPSQVRFLNSLLENKMVSTDSSWKAIEGGLYYHIFSKENSVRMVVTVDVNKAGDLENIRKIAECYFPDKADEIYGVVLAKNDKFKNKKIDIDDYKYAEKEKRLTVRAFNIDNDQYVSTEIIFST